MGTLIPLLRHTSGNKTAHTSVSVPTLSDFVTSMVRRTSPITDIRVFSISSALCLFFLCLGGGEIIAQNSSSSPSGITFSQEQLVRYVQAVRSIERKRAEILRQAKNSQAWAVSVQLAEQTNRDVCAVPHQQQPESIQLLCKQLFEFSEQEIRRHGLTNREFNQITIAQRQNPQLQGRIQGLLQQTSKSIAKP